MLQHPASKSNSPPPPHPPGTAKAKRSMVPVACGNCKRRKIKCDGQTPCSPCSQRSYHCLYDSDPMARRSVTLKRKYDVVQTERDQMVELYGLLQARPEAEALEILKRIRASTDVSAVLTLVREGDLLVQQPPWNKVIRNDSFDTYHHNRSRTPQRTEKPKSSAPRPRQCRSCSHSCLPQPTHWYPRSACKCHFEPIANRPDVVGGQN
ncbi:uncharacterized protein K452DRAFT_266029 [Aplosporella prunicola CBS 121167]|uniref:Zn(2)-C6 fungal-type domain-containing protein n=1 Tax=Aplosporella prunicola CBS 121167 TaxID=1176127 RepID=A0A6A6BP89_9PEZI|nr:uncharacterized protein K452DRAFT_266029 [Aplosporella prunicola CBS 121167]KAF2145263.1 hypothetical protein K452DRAFT_266029 [Aplosporella prunicola CBS 121167]